MKRRNSFLMLVFFILLNFTSCKNTPAECKTANIKIENRWYDENGGIDNLEVKDKKDIAFICNRINNFPEGKDVRISSNHGYLTIFLNNQKTDMIFTVRNGIVYRVGVGKYVYDEALTKRVLKLMKITHRCWGEDCK